MPPVATFSQAITPQGPILDVETAPPDAVTPMLLSRHCELLDNLSRYLSRELQSLIQALPRL